MTDKQVGLRQRLQRLGFTKGTQMKLYGEAFDFLDEPIVLTDDFVVIDAQQKKTGRTRRVTIPRPLVHMASKNGIAA
ncbi:MAG TPA: hypothetical protein VH437_23065 [Terriglobales bacterium]|jgi:hypothetical protein